MAGTLSRAVLKGSIAGAVQIRNMFTADVEEGDGDPPFTYWSEYLDVIFEDIKAYLTTSLTYTSIEAQQFLGGGWITVSEDPIVWTGTGAGDFLPNLVSVVMVAKCFGRRLMGRKFFSGLIESASNDNSLGSAAFTAFAAATVDWIAPFTSTGLSILTPGIKDKTNAFRPFTSGVVSSLLGSMRRRKPGIGI